MAQKHTSELETSTHEIVALTQDLIRYKTLSNDLDELCACAGFIASYLERHGIDYIQKQNNGVPSILVKPGRDDFPVLLMSHIDVVAGSEKLFVPEVKDGRLYGRGAADDKYAVALSMVLMKNYCEKYKAAGKSLADLDFGILITGDEEVGGRNGAVRMLADIRPEFTIALDGGTPENIVTKEKGILRLKLEAFGESCHGSRPWLGSNAIDMLVQDYLVLKPYFDLSSPDHWHRTLNPAIVEGGEVINQVPDYSCMKFDVRFTENDDMDALVADIQNQIKGRLTIISRAPVFETKPTPYLDRLLALAPGIELGFAHGASDARHLMPYGLNGAVWGAQGNLSHHSENEHLEIESVKVLYERLDRFVSMP